jgi:hypothetical protein
VQTKKDEDEDDDTNARKGGDDSDSDDSDASGDRASSASGQSLTSDRQSTDRLSERNSRLYSNRSTDIFPRMSRDQSFEIESHTAVTLVRPAQTPPRDNDTKTTPYKVSQQTPPEKPKAAARRGSIGAWLMGVMNPEENKSPTEDKMQDDDEESTVDNDDVSSASGITVHSSSMYSSDMSHNGSFIMSPDGSSKSRLFSPPNSP